MGLSEAPVLAQITSFEDDERGIIVARFHLPFVVASLLGASRLITGLPAAGGLLRSAYRIVAEVHLPDDQVISMRPLSDDPYVVNEIYNWHAYDHCPGVGPGAVVIDVGAQIGVFATRMAKMVGPSGLVIAVEPEPENFGLLALNSRRNGGAAIFAHQMALGSYVGTCWLLVRTDGHTAGHRVRWLGPGDGLEENGTTSGLITQCSTLDAVVNDAHVSRIDLIKIDVEGSELAVLNGASECLQRFRPRIVLESHPQGARREEIERWLGQAAYCVHENETMPWILCAEPKPEQHNPPVDALVAGTSGS